MSIIDNVRIAALKSGYKHHVIASKMGLTVQQFSDLINGRKVFRAEHLQKFCEVVKVSPNEILGYGKKEK